MTTPNITNHNSLYSDKNGNSDSTFPPRVWIHHGKNRPVAHNDNSDPWGTLKIPRIEYLSLAEHEAIVAKIKKEYSDYKTHYDRLFASGVLIPTDEYVALQSRLDAAEALLRECDDAFDSIRIADEFKAVTPRPKDIAKKMLTKLREHFKPGGVGRASDSKSNEGGSNPPPGANGG